MAAFRWTAARVKGALGALTSPAEDPRQQYADTRETHLESLGRLRTAREEVEAALDRLNALADKARQSFDALESGVTATGGSDRFADELKRDLQEEMSALKRQAETLQQQQEHLVLTERRLVSSLRRGAVTRELEGASDASRQAHDLARSTLASSPEISGLDRAIDSARQATQRLQDRALTVDKMASLGARLRDDRQGTESRDLRLVDRYAHVLETTSDETARGVLQKGLDALRNLMYEHEQLRDTLADPNTAPGVGAARIEILGAQAYKRGLDALEKAFELIDSIPAVDEWTSPAPDAAAPARAEALIATSARWEATIRAAKDDLISNDPDDPRAGVLEAEARFKESRNDLRSIDADRDR